VALKADVVSYRNCLGEDQVSLLKPGVEIRSNRRKHLKDRCLINVIFNKQEEKLCDVFRVKNEKFRTKS